MKTLQYLMQVQKCFYFLISNSIPYLSKRLEFFILNSSKEQIVDWKVPSSMLQLPQVFMLQKFYQKKEFFTKFEHSTLNILLLYMNQFNVKQVEEWKPVLFHLMDRIPYDPFYVRKLSKVPFILQQASKACFIYNLCEFNQNIDPYYFNSLLQEVHLCPQIHYKCPVKFDTSKNYSDCMDTLIWSSSFFSAKIPTNFPPSQQEEFIFRALQKYGIVYHIIEGFSPNRAFYFKLLKEDPNFFVCFDEYKMDDEAIQYVLKYSVIVRGVSPANYIPEQYWSNSKERILQLLKVCHLNFETLSKHFLKEWKSDAYMIQQAILSHSSNVKLLSTEEWNADIDFSAKILSNIDIF